MTNSGCLSVGTIYRGSKRSNDLGRRTVVDPILKTLKLLSSENITFFHSSVVQWVYILANARSCFFICSGRGFIQLYSLANPSPFGGGAAQYELWHFSTNLDEESADPMPLNKDFFGVVS